ncbi:MAG: uroporphyrinogen decarboxylase family protein, partial [Ruthenibacterium sp.]
EAFRFCKLDAAVTCFASDSHTTEQWKVHTKKRQMEDYTAIDYTIETPEGILTTTEGNNEITTWVVEYLIKNKEDILLLQKYCPLPTLQRDTIRRTYDAIGDAGILRTFLCGKQGGCWQDACELYGAENLIMETFDDPEWVHAFLSILLEMKLRYIDENLYGMPFDLVETGGGAASNTLISPAIHEEFCLPYDIKIHDAVHRAGFPVVYHTCGGMSKITHLLAQNHCDISETLSPAGVGGDIADDATAKQVYADLFPHVGLIGGMDQFNILQKGTPQQIRAEVERLFALYGQNGGYMMSACDHFFHVPKENLLYYAQAAHTCTY